MGQDSCSRGSACGCAAAPAVAPDRPDDLALEGCSGGEAFALMVLGDSMAPEFNHGEIIIVEPDGAVHDGSFVLAFTGGEWVFRQLRQDGERWQLQALHPAAAPMPLPDLDAVRGVIIQKALPGRRRASKRYV